MTSIDPSLLYSTENAVRITKKIKELEDFQFRLERDGKLLTVDTDTGNITKTIVTPSEELKKVMRLQINSEIDGLNKELEKFVKRC